MSININIDTHGNSYHRKQLFYTFKNGFSCSVVWGTGLYCDNRYDRYDESGKRGNDFNKTEEVEIAVMKNGEIIYNVEVEGLNHCDVFGWVSADEMAEILYKVSKLPEDFSGYTLTWRTKEQEKEDEEEFKREEAERER